LYPASMGCFVERFRGWFTSGALSIVGVWRSIF
jgi:hypothetical protein